MIRQLIDILLLRIGTIFMALWVGCWVWTHYGCAHVPEAEMEPAVEHGAFKFMSRLDEPGQLSTGQIVSYARDAEARAGRIMGTPGTVCELEYRLWRHSTLPPLTVRVLVPADHFVIIGDNAAVARDVDSRRYGTIGFYAVRGRLGGGN